jgi:AcrR family transcriptional regulator
MTTQPSLVDAIPRREQILDAALALFARYGLNNVTTRQIAAAVGISQPSLYAHFPNRDAICAAVCVRAMEGLYNSLITAVAPSDPVRVRLMRLGQNYLHFGMTNEAAYRVAFMGEMANDRFMPDQPVLEAGLRAFGVLHTLIDEIYPDDPHLAALRAQSTWASIHGLTSLLLGCPDFPWVDREGFIALHLETIADQLTGALPARS